jgi:RNA polymerase sigma-70 factor (ECF subfamily)
MDDLALCEAAARGDPRAFTRLVRRHEQAVVGFLLRMTRGRHALADDLAQETFLEAFRKIGQFRGDGPFAGWLLRIAYFRFLAGARRNSAEVGGLETVDPVGAESETSRAAKLDLEKAMSQLGDAERAALTLHFALGCSHGETADIMAVPLGTAKSHILRGRERLKALLAAWVSEPV